MRKLNKRWLLILVFISLLSASAFNRRYKQVNAGEAKTTEVTPYKKPSGNATRFLGIWLSSGYILQPEQTTYIEAGKFKSIYSEAGRSMAVQWATAFHNKKYQWYQSTDGKTWGEVPKNDNGKNKNLKVEPKEAGTTYYQLDTYWKSPTGWTTASHLYSNVATVHAVPEPVDAQEVKVTTDDDYLYNADDEIVSNETYAHAHPTPVDFTGDVSWSIDNTNLATIDKESGLITANTKGLSGKVMVTATMHNPVGADITGEKEVTIGGGLDDQTVKAGKTATFDLRGNIGDLDEEGEDTNYSVEWYKEDPITHVRGRITTTDPHDLSYTTPKTTLDDDGTLYSATIKVKYSGKNYSYTTNDALLHVTPVGGPDIEMTNSLTNNTFNDGSNSSTMLFGVNNNDVITYNDTVTNKSTSGTLSDAKYVLPLRVGTRVTSVKVDGEDVNSDNYEMKHNYATGSNDLIISGLNFKINDSHQIEVETMVSGITARESFRLIPYIYGTSDSDDSTYQKVGDDEIINYTTDTAVIKQVQDIDYGTINGISSAKTLTRQAELNLPNNVVEVEDMRRNKKPVKIVVVQDGALQTANGDVFAGQLRYYDNGHYKNLDEGPVAVTETQADEELISFGWDEDNGILLFLESKWNVAGTYSTTLNWSIEDSI